MVFFAPSAPTRPVPGGSAPRPPLAALNGLVLKRRTGCEAVPAGGWQLGLARLVLKRRTG